MTFYCDFTAGSDGPGVQELKRVEKEQKRREGSGFFGKRFWSFPPTEKNKRTFFGYVILLLFDSPEQLEIYSLREYAFRRLYLRDGLIVGSGETIDSCLDRIYELAEETYQKTGGLEIRKEILKKQEERKKLWQS